MITVRVSEDTLAVELDDETKKIARITACGALAGLGSVSRGRRPLASAGPRSIV